MSDVLLSAPVHRPSVGPADLLSAPQSLFFSSLDLSISHSLSSHVFVPLSILAAFHQTHSGLSAPVILWGCPKLPVVFPAALESAEGQGAVVSLDQAGCAPAGAAQCCHHVLHLLCAGMSLYTRAHHSCLSPSCHTALQRAPFKCTRRCVGTHTCRIAPPAALSSACCILFHIFQLSLV